jgi:lysozyme
MERQPAVGQVMRVSEAALERLRMREALSLMPYRDAAGVWTVGYGTTVYPNGQRVKWSDSCTQAEAEAWFRYDLERFERCVLETLPLVPLNQPMFDALVSFAYNIGEEAFRTSTLARRLNAGQYIEAQAEFDRWVKAGGVVLKGLVNRRNFEQAEFNEGIRQALADQPATLALFNRFVREMDAA